MDWIDADASWRNLPEVSSEEAQIRVREAVPEALARLTLPAWAECGPGCEWIDLTEFEPWFPSIDTVDLGADSRVFVSFMQPRPGNNFRRYVDLRSGQTIGALRFDSTIADPQPPPYGPSIGKSAFMTTLFSNDRMLHTLYDHRAGLWEFKLPWSEINDPVCERWMLDSSPPVLFYGCGPVLTVSGAGSNVRTFIEESGDYGSGAGNAGLSVWSELDREPPTSSRLRTWTPEAGTGVLVDALPGIACELAVSPTRVAGLRSGDPEQITSCSHPLGEPTFWSVSREDGSIRSWPVPGVERVSPARTSTWGDHAAAMVLTGDFALPNSDRSSLWLLRFSDGKLRRLIPSPNQEWVGALLALDDTHLYIGESAEGATGSTLARIIRYRLDHFDQIGTPLE